MECEECGNIGLMKLFTVDVEIEAVYKLIVTPNNIIDDDDYTPELTYGKKNILWSSLNQKVGPAFTLRCEECGWEGNNDELDLIYVVGLEEIE